MMRQACTVWRLGVNTLLFYGKSMQVMETKKEQREIYDLFFIGVLIKAGQGVIELIAGAFLFFVPLSAITHLADRFTEVELANDPQDFIATHVTDFVHGISGGSKDFAVLYLLINGALKLSLAVALLTGKRWAYPVALPLLGAFILYLIYRVYLHHSPLLTVAVFLDIAVLYFIWREYLIVKKKEGS